MYIVISSLSNKDITLSESSVLLSSIITICGLLKEEKFIRDMILIHDNKQDMMRIFLKYDYGKKAVIHGILRYSKPGCRRYVASDNLPRVLNGMGISILSTSKGVVSDKKAELLNVGGEVLCQVW